MDNYYGYVYETKNLINGKIYIGQHKSSKHDKKYFGSGTYFLKSFKKYGVENFENTILEWCFDAESLNRSEIKWISKKNSLYPNGYNITPGGSFGDTFTYKSSSDKDKLRRNMSKNRIGYKHSDEWKTAMSKRVSGKGNPMYGKIGTNKGKKFSAEHIERIRSSNLGKKRTEEQKRVLSLAHKNQKISKENLEKLVESNKKKVIVYFDGRELERFDSAKECLAVYHEKIGISSKKFYANLRNNIPIFDENKKTISKEIQNKLYKIRLYSFKYI